MIRGLQTLGEVLAFPGYWQMLLKRTHTQKEQPMTLVITLLLLALLSLALLAMAYKFMELIYKLYKAEQQTVAVLVKGFGARGRFESRDIDPDLRERLGKIDFNSSIIEEEEEGPTATHERGFSDDKKLET